MRDGIRDSGEIGRVVAAATAGDESAFSSLVARYRPELRVHCYRMLGSFDDSEDMVQETFLRAWRKRASFEGRASFRAWLYRIATNVCLDFLARAPRRAAARLDAGPEVPPPAEIPWLQPYPDRLLDEVPSDESDPAASVIAKETIALAFLVAVQHLSARERAALILRDVLDWSAKETADLLETSTASVNSALQRARATMGDVRFDGEVARSSATDPTEHERALLQRYMDAHERADVACIATMLRDDVRLSMPPHPVWYVGRNAVVAFFADIAFAPSTGEFRLVATRANGQPAAANYLRRPDDTAFRALTIDVLKFVDGKIADITAFEASLFPAFGLPETWDEAASATPR